MNRDEIFGGMPEGARVVAGNACGTPLTLLSALAEHAERAELAGEVTLTAGLLFGDPPLDAAVRSGALRVRSWHVHGALRRLHREGLIDYLPIRLLDVPRTVLRDADVALVRVGPPDACGFCSLGPSTSFAAEAVEHAGLVIAEVSPDVPRTRGASTVHVSHIDRFVRSETPVPAYTPATPDPVSLTVARNVLGLLPDGATVQLGIGAVPEGLAAELTPLAAERSFGLLGMVTTPMIPLVEAVVAAGRGPVRAVELVGDRRLMTWADDNPMIEMGSSQRLHHPAVLADEPAFVSVNSAIAVDLRGQVVSESARGAVLAGVGGSADFAEGAHLSPGGLRVIAFRSTTRDGTSTIVAAHDPADTVTAPHHSVDAVVTEHGCAWLRGRTQRERRDELIAVAAPEHRGQLTEGES